MHRVAELLSAAWWTRRAAAGDSDARKWLAGVWYDAGLGDPAYAGDLRQAAENVRRQALALADQLIANGRA